MEGAFLRLFCISFQIKKPRRRQSTRHTKLIRFYVSIIATIFQVDNKGVFFKTVGDKLRPWKIGNKGTRSA